MEVSTCKRRDRNSSSLMEAIKNHDMSEILALLESRKVVDFRHVKQLINERIRYHETRKRWFDSSHRIPFEYFQVLWCKFFSKFTPDYDECWILSKKMAKYGKLKEFKFAIRNGLFISSSIIGGMLEYCDYIEMRKYLLFLDEELSNPCLTDEMRRNYNFDEEKFNQYQKE